MKKSTTAATRPRKLTLNHEVIAALVPLELRHVVGGSFSGWPPRCISDDPCVEDRG